MITPTYTVTLTIPKNCYHETSITKNCIHVPSSVVLEIGNVNAKASNLE